jgi:hypothetical protein
MTALNPAVFPARQMRRAFDEFSWPQELRFTAPGGGSLMTAQKTPTCLMDSTNF